MELNRKTLRAAIEKTGPDHSTVNAMYQVASALNELTITTMKSQERAEDAEDEEFSPEEDPIGGTVITAPGVTFSPLTYKDEEDSSGGEETTKLIPGKQIIYGDDY